MTVEAHSKSFIRLLLVCSFTVKISSLQGTLPASPPKLYSTSGVTDNALLMAVSPNRNVQQVLIHQMWLGTDVPKPHLVPCSPRDSHPGSQLPRPIPHGLLQGEQWVGVWGKREFWGRGRGFLSATCPAGLLELQSLELHLSYWWA